MKSIFEITMKNKMLNADITQLIVRIEGLDRNSAVLLAEKIYGPGFIVYYVIAGPRNEV